MLAEAFPTGQGSQLIEEDRKVPAAQAESHSDEAAIEKRPTGQLSQMLAPLPLFFPATHGEQVTVPVADAK
jgi:hypothetical protein